MELENGIKNAIANALKIALPLGSVYLDNVYQSGITEFYKSRWNSSIASIKCT